MTTVIFACVHNAGRSQMAAAFAAELAAGAGHLVTMGCGEECPYLPGLQVQDWALEDPKGQPTERVRAIRDDIRARVRAFVDAQGWGPAPR